MSLDPLRLGAFDPGRARWPTEFKVKLDLRLVCRDLVNNSAPILRMRERPDFSSWAEVLTTWADKEALAPFRAVLQALAENALTNLGPLESFLAGHDPTNFKEGQQGSAAKKVQTASRVNKFLHKSRQERRGLEDFFEAAAFADMLVKIGTPPSSLPSSSRSHGHVDAVTSFTIRPRRRQFGAGVQSYRFSRGRLSRPEPSPRRV